MREYIDAVVEVLNSGPMEQIQAHYLDDLPNECVGVVWDDGEVARLINQARSPERFAVSLPQLSIEFGRREGMVIAMYHSHPSGSTALSSPDRHNMRQQFRDGAFIPWLVVTESESNLFFIEEGKVGSAPVRNGLVHV